MLEKLRPYIELTRLNKPIGIYLLLWPTAWALYLAAPLDQQDGFINLIFALGVIVMRSAGCVINDYADRDIDGKVARTGSRPLADNRVSPRQALLFFGGLIGLAFILVLQLKVQTILFSAVALFLATLYPFTKRYIWYPQFFLALAFSSAILMAFIEYQGQLPVICWLLFALNMFWVIAYDTIYALADIVDDEKANIKSTARWFGSYAHRICWSLQAAFLLGFLGLAYSFLDTQWPFLIFWGVALGLTVYQAFLMRSKQPHNYLKAFLNNHWVGFSLFLGLLFGTTVV